MKKILSLCFFSLCYLGIFVSVQAATLNFSGSYDLSGGGSHKVASSSVYSHTKSNVKYSATGSPNPYHTSLVFYTKNVSSGKTSANVQVTADKTVSVPLPPVLHPGNQVELYFNKGLPEGYKININSGSWIVE